MLDLHIIVPRSNYDGIIVHLHARTQAHRPDADTPGLSFLFQAVHLQQGVFPRRNNPLSIFRNQNTTYTFPVRMKGGIFFDICYIAFSIMEYFIDLFLHL